MYAAVLVGLLAAATFSNSILSMDWVFDDHFAVVENPDLRESAPVNIILMGQFWSNIPMLTRLVCSC